MDTRTITQPRPRGTPVACRGVTMVELLIVMGLMSLLFGIAAAGLTRSTQGSKLDIAWRLVRTALNDAKSLARENQGLGRVFLQPSAPPQVMVQRGRVAGTWSCDEVEGDRLLGGRNNYARLRGGKIVEGGIVRNAADLSGGKVIEAEPAPFYDPTFGFSLAADVYPEKDGRGGSLFSYGTSFTLDLDENGGLSARLDLDGHDEPIDVKTPPGVLAFGRWCRIELAFDGLEVRILAHGVVEGQKRLPPEIAGRSGARVAAPDAQARLTIGSRAFSGLVDEIVYRTLEEPEILGLDPDIEIPLQSPLEIRFDTDGRLDPRVHEEAVVIPLVLEGDKKEISIDLPGVIR